jgi:hypothetical protein
MGGIQALTVASPESCWIQPSTRAIYAAAIEGDNGGAMTMVVGLYSQPQKCNK